MVKYLDCLQGGGRRRSGSYRKGIMAEGEEEGFAREFAIAGEYGEIEEAILIYLYEPSWLGRWHRKPGPGSETRVVQTRVVAFR